SSSVHMNYPRKPPLPPVPAYGLQNYVVDDRSGSGEASTRAQARCGRRSAKYVSGRGEENACAAGLAPDTLIGRAGLRPIVISGIEFLVVDHQLAVKQIQLFDYGVAVRRIRDPR